MRYENNSQEVQSLKAEVDELYEFVEFLAKYVDEAGRDAIKFMELKYHPMTLKIVKDLIEQRHAKPTNRTND